MNWLGWTIVLVIAAILLGVVTWAYRLPDSKAAQIYFGFVGGGTVTSIAVAFVAGLSGHGFLEAFGATLVVAGTSAQIAVDANRKNGDPLIPEGAQKDAARVAGWGLILAAALSAVGVIFFGDAMSRL